MVATSFPSADRKPIRLAASTTTVPVFKVYRIQGTVVLQNVANDSYAPHVSRVANIFEAHDFWRHKFRRPKQHLQLFLGVVLPRQTKVNQLDLIPGSADAQHVLGLKGKHFS